MAYLALTLNVKNNGEFFQTDVAGFAFCETKHKVKKKSPPLDNVVNDWL